jgi:UDP-N-acetylglucosamine transferase subunit ALG13
MILVTVGTEKFAFDRLMQWVDHLIRPLAKVSIASKLS